MGSIMRMYGVLRRVLLRCARLSRAMRRRLVMFAQQILAEIAVEIAADRVDVIGVVLRVVVFDQESRALAAVIMLIAFVLAARPREIYLVEAGVAKLLRPLVGYVLRHPRQIFIEQFLEQRLLLFVQLTGRDAFGFERIGLSFIHRDDVARRGFV